jgi:hypothetical protein
VLTAISMLILSKGAYASSGVAERADRPDESPSLPGVHPAFVAVAGFALGWVSRLVRPYASVDGTHYEAIAALVLLIAASAYALRQHARHREQGGFQLDLVALWGGYAAGWVLFNGGFWSDMTFVFGAYWGGVALAGGMLIEWLRRRYESPDAVR